MKSRALVGIATVALLSVFTAQSVFGQGIYRGRNDNPNGPTVSPYLNLLQNNNPLNPVTNYQALVKPLINQGNAIQQQGNAIRQLQQGPGGGVPSYGGPQTGRHTYFMYYSHYFPGATGR